MPEVIVHCLDMGVREVQPALEAADASHFAEQGLPQEVDPMDSINPPLQ